MSDARTALPATESPVPAGPLDDDDLDDSRRSHPRSVMFLLRGAVVVVALLVWEFVLPKFVDDFFVSRPTDVWDQLVEWIRDGSLFGHIRVTFTELAFGFVFGASAGMGVGVVFGLSRRLADVFEPFILGLYSMPKIALMPLFIVWFGLDMKPKIVLSAVLVFFIVFFNTLSGVLDVDEELIDVVSVMGAKRWERVRRVIVPSALTWIFAGMRISIPQAFSGAVAGELIASSSGLGYLIVRASATFNTAGVFAGLLILVVLGAAMGMILRAIENRVVAWKRTDGRGGPAQQGATSLPL